MIRDRLLYPCRVSASSVRWEPSVRVTSAPVMAWTSTLRATWAKCMAPHRLSWSVMARARWPSSLERTKSSSTEDAPS